MKPISRHITNQTICMKYTLPVILAAFFLLPACVSVKPVQYLERRTDTTLVTELTAPIPTIQPGDLISVTVYSDNPAASALFNPGGGSPMNSISGGGSQVGNSIAGMNASGYQVMQNGNIVMPGIGTVPVQGFTCQQLADSLTRYFSERNLLQNPACDVRYLSYKISVLGEVGHPGLFSVPANRVNVLEALGMAGDFTIWSVKDNVTVIREENGRKILGKIDLTSDQAFHSPFFNLRQNDIVMVDARKRKVQSMDQVNFRYISVAATIVSTVGLIITIFRR